MPPDSRFHPQAAATLRAAIRDAGGVEVFAIGRVDAEGRVTDLDIHARGNAGAVPALLSRPRPGEVVIHNHPSGVLVASEADFALAARYGEDGVGVVIVNNAVSAATWVVEPAKKKEMLIDEGEVERFFTEALPRALPGYEARPGQVAMARAVCRAFNHGEIAVLEAGTGTGKSLAYLVPAALWAKANQGRVAVATFTITLQGQLVTSDLPTLSKGGIDVRYALLKGRTNYLCRRRLEEANKEASERPGPDRDALRALQAWATTGGEGSRSDLPFPVDEDLWERVESDHDQTLRVRCPHYGSCFYYEARRAAAQSHLLVLNHHLLLSDLAVKAETGGEAGLLPKYDRLVIDEAHHLEDAATSLFEDRLTARALSRALGALLDRERRPGALGRIAGYHLSEDVRLPPAARHRGLEALGKLQGLLPVLRQQTRGALEVLAELYLSPETPAVRINPAMEAEINWTVQAEPLLGELHRGLAEATRHLSVLEEALQELPEPAVVREPQPIFDLGRARRRLAEHAGLADNFRRETEGTVRWLDLARERGAPSAAALCRAPVEVAAAVRTRVMDPNHSVILTSATLTVGGKFDHLLGRIGLESYPRVVTGLYPSPFDYKQQAMLGLPRDLPEPDAPGFEAAAATYLIDLLRITGGGAFVLCTSFTMLRALHARVSAVLGQELVLMKQGELGRNELLRRFKESPSSVLFGTDSFWEGVSVAGDALRLVVIPRLPFRVPTEPISQARYERLAAQGQDPFRAYALPQAVLRFRQGFGRLIRTQKDRGAVIVLDNRVSSRWYGRVFLASLPEMERVTGPGRMVLERVAGFYGRPGSAG